MCLSGVNKQARGRTRREVFLFYIIASMHESCFITTFVIIQGKVVNTIDGGESERERGNKGNREKGGKEGEMKREGEEVGEGIQLLLFMCFVCVCVCVLSDCRHVKKEALYMSTVSTLFSSTCSAKTCRGGARGLRSHLATLAQEISPHDRHRAPSQVHCRCCPIASRHCLHRSHCRR